MQDFSKIDKIAEALCKAQAQFKIAAKNGLNPHFSSRYSTLEDVTNAIRDGLTKNGLSYTHVIETVLDDDGNYSALLQTVLMHGESGQYIMSVYPLKLTGTSHQRGSEITYGKRYNLSAITGVVSDEDDDGNASVEAQSKQSRNNGTTPKKYQSINKNESQEQKQKSLREASASNLSQRTRLINTLKHLGIKTNIEIAAMVNTAKEDCGINKDAKDFTEDEGDAVFDNVLTQWALKQLPAASDEEINTWWDADIAPMYESSNGAKADDIGIINAWKQRINEEQNNNPNNRIALELNGEVLDAKTNEAVQQKRKSRRKQPTPALDKEIMNAEGPFED